MIRDDRARPESDPETLAIGALTYIAGEPELLHRFLALTGLEPGEIRLAAREPGFLAGVLDFLMDHESILLTYATSIDRSPKDFISARERLSASLDRSQ
jgi:hypothetical protein